MVDMAPRGGLILTKEEHAKKVDKNIFPGIQGGPLMHVLAAKAVAFGEALNPEFKEYQEQVIKNAKTLAGRLSEKGLRIVIPAQLRELEDKPWPKYK